MAAKTISAFSAKSPVVSTDEVPLYDPTGATAALKNRRATLGTLLSWISANLSFKSLADDTSPQLGGFLDANGHQIRASKGADVASSATLTLGDDGNYFVVTGTTGITAIATKGVGTKVSLRFAASLTLTHHATDLILPSGANITTAAGDVAVFREYASGDWVCESYTRASGHALMGAALTNPMTTLGDLITGGAAGAPARLAVGTEGQVLKVVGGVPAWGAAPGGGIAEVVEDTSPDLGGPLNANGHQIRASKGADVASAATLTLGDDGNYFVVTGTTGITAIATKGVGTKVSLRFAGSLPLTHHATDLILPSGANITTAAGDVAVFREYASGDWVCECYQRASGAALVGSGGMTNPMTTLHDLIVGGASGTPGRLAVGAANKFLGINGGGPGYLFPPLLYERQIFSIVTSVSTGDVDFFVAPRSGKIIWIEGEIYTPGTYDVEITVQISGSGSDAVALTAAAAAGTLKYGSAGADIPVSAGALVGIRVIADGTTSGSMSGGTAAQGLRAGIVFMPD